MADLTGAERVVIDQWIEARLAANAAALEAVSSGSSDRIFEGIAPKGTPYPFITYQVQVDPRDIRGIGTVTVMVEATYLIKVWTQGLLTATAGFLLNAVHEAITTSTGDEVAIGGRVMDAVKQESFHLDETIDGNIVRQIGGQYQIHAQGV